MSENENIWKEEDRLKDGNVYAIINSRPGKQPNSKLYSIKLGRVVKNEEKGEIFLPFLRPQDLSKGRLLLEEASYWIDKDRDERYQENKDNNNKKKGR